MTGAEEIAAERRRQVAVEGYDAEHDRNASGNLSRAAACYGTPVEYRDFADPPSLWPWDAEYWKPGDRRRELVKAGALIAAAIDSMDADGS